MAKSVQLEWTPAVIADRAGRALAEVCGEVFGSRLEAVILTGSTAREEITFRCQNGQAVLLGDVEAVVVLASSVLLPARAANAALCARVERWLAEGGVLAHVGLSLVHREYLRQLPAHIYSYELRACGRVVYGAHDILECIPGDDPSRLLREDAWRLLSNRLVEMLEGQADESDTARQYRAVKLCLDLAASLLVFQGRFQAGYAARLRCMEALACEGVGDLPFAISEFLPLLRLATEAKLHGEMSGVNAEFAERVLSLAWQAWCWELERMTDGADVRARLCTLGRSHGMASQLRGWLYAVRRIGPDALRHGFRWLGLVAAGWTPRHAVYFATYQLYAAPQAEREVRSLLPVAHSSVALRQQIGWNYREFVAETRA